MFSSEKASPAPSARTENTERLAKPCSSSSTASTRFAPVPRTACASRTAFTSAFNSPGSTAKRWSGPGKWFDSVTCFSTTTAPSATATTGAITGSREWSDSPTWHPVASRSVTMARALTSAGGVG